MKAYCKDFDATGSWAALSGTYLGFKGNLGALPSNPTNLQIRVGTDASTEIELVAGEYWPIDGCDISQLQIKGAGCVLRAFGITVSGGW